MTARTYGAVEARRWQWQLIPAEIPSKAGKHISKIIAETRHVQSEVLLHLWRSRWRLGGAGIAAGGQ